jgi:Flp pilus assembly protein TadG
MNERSSRRRAGGGAGERGEAAVLWCLLAALLLLPMAGISVDLWRAISVQRTLQAAAEAAAAAGAQGLDVATYRARGCVALSPGLAGELARQEVARQYGLGQLSRATVAVAPGGASVSVVLEQSVPLLLLRVVEGDRPLVVAASATGRALASGGSPLCTG